MTKTLIDLDDALLVQCQEVLGTTSKKATVNGALQELTRLAAVQRFLLSVKDADAQHAVSGFVLVDASALAYCDHPEVMARLVPLLVLDVVATCAAVDHELAGLAGDEEAAGPLAVLREAGLRWLATDDADLRRAAEIQAELTNHGSPRLPWHRLVTSAVAQRHRVTLLHYASDYEAITKVTNQRAEWIVPPDSLPERPADAPGP